MRHVKQLIYGIFYLAIWAGLIGGLYAWQKPTPTCFDNRKNQDETGIDCGGKCAKVCIPEAIAPLAQSGDPKMLLIGSSSDTSRISIVSEVQNLNSDFGASSFEYTFRVYDSIGNVLGSFPGRSFIYPGEIKRLALLNEALPTGSSPSYAKLSIQNPLWTPALNFPRPALIVQSSNTSESNGNIVTRGVLVNQDSVNFQSVYVTALYYDASGILVGVSGTERNNVTAGETREFSLFHPIIPNAVPERTQVYVTALNIR